MSIIIYFHICIMNGWLDICRNLFHRIRQSGLYDHVKEIRVVVLGRYPMDDIDFLLDPKVRILFTSENMSLFENVTLDRMRQDAASEDFKVLYIHSKGVKNRPPHEILNVADWVSFMCHFLMDRYAQCLELLDTTCNAVGVNLRPEPEWHYSGNFWWSKASHVRTLLAVPLTFHGPEFWVTSKKCTYCCLMMSGKNHYNESYPEHVYCDKSSEVFILNFPA